MSQRFGLTEIISVVPVLSTSAYTAGDLMGVGGALAIANAGKLSRGGILHNIVVVDKAKQNAPFDLVFFTTNLPNSTLTDNAAFAPHATDLLNALFHVSILAADYSQFSANSLATKSGLALLFGNELTNDTAYMVLVSRGTPTFAVSSLEIQLHILYN